MPIGLHVDVADVVAIYGVRYRLPRPKRRVRHPNLGTPFIAPKRRGEETLAALSAFMVVLIERERIPAERGERPEGGVVNRDDPRATDQSLPSFDRFFAEEYQRLARALFIVVGDPAEAEDLAQEAMVRVFERWDRVAALESPTGYLYRTALNLHRSRTRRKALGRKRRHRAEQPDPLAAADDRKELTRLLGALPASQREALALVEWLGMPAEDASRILGIAPVSVRVRLSRAKAALRAEHEATGERGDDR
jgi:RNA polymerase sigma-70 factor, ECF subfamily